MIGRSISKTIVADKWFPGHETECLVNFLRFLAKTQTVGIKYVSAPMYTVHYDFGQTEEQYVTVEME